TPAEPPTPAHSPPIAWPATITRSAAFAHSAAFTRSTAGPAPFAGAPAIIRAAALVRHPQQKSFILDNPLHLPAHMHVDIGSFPSQPLFLVRQRCAQARNPQVA